MRQERTVQTSLFDLFAEHEIGRELKAMSQWLDEHCELIGLATEDRVMVRLLKTADALVGALVWRNHRRAAKKRARAIEYARDRSTRVRHYRELIKLTRGPWLMPIRPPRSYGKRRTRWPPRCGKPSSVTIVR
jgi:hypothetical protein